MKKVILAALAVVAMASCAKHQSAEGAITAPEEINFTSGVDSRVSGDQWVEGDKIGVLAISENDNAPDADFTYENIMYSADQGGSSTSFSLGEGQTPIIDEQQCGMYILAYYPYNEDYEDLSDDIFNISDQTDLEALIHMSAEAMVEAGETQVDLTFEHSMAKVQFNVSCKASLGTLEGMSFAMSNVQTAGNVFQAGSLNDDTAVYGTIDSAVIDFADDFSTASIEMVLFTTGYYSTKAELIFSFGDSAPYTASFFVTLTAGQIHSYNVIIGADEVEVSGAVITDWGKIDGGELDTEQAS
ncbi:MAG: fimbrillin family protein [Rikenellaceae bacterium]